MESLKVSPGALLALVQDGRLPQPAEGSPLREAIARASAAEEAPAHLDGPYEEGFHMLAEPDGFVRLTVAVPDEARTVFRAALKGGRAAMFASEPSGVSVAAPIDRAALARRLTAEATHLGPLSGQRKLLWPSVLRMMTFLWQETKDPAQVLSRKQAEARLVESGSVDRAADAALGDLILAGWLERSGDTILVPEELRPWMALFWSGHALQVEHLPSSAPGARVGERLLFLGPSGRRVQARELTGEALAQRLAGRPAREDKALELSAPPHDEVEASLRRLVGA